MRIPGILPAVVTAATLLAGCDLFQTREFARRPAEIRAFTEDFTRGDTLKFRVIESLAAPGSPDSGTVLARRLLGFAKAPDAQQPGGGWIAVSFRVVSDPPGSYQDEGLCWLRFDSEGLTLKAPDSSSGGSGAVYYPLKRSAPPAAGGEAAPTAADSGAFLALPPAFAAGSSWAQGLGPLNVLREIVETDTLEYGGRIEEAWRVSETVSEGGRPLASGRYWYGASGLLRGEQAWPFAGRSADGTAAAAQELRRVMVRL